MLDYAITVTNSAAASAQPHATHHLGIVAVSPEGAAPFYRKIYREAGHLTGDPHLHPRVTLHNEPMADYVDALNAQNWHAIAQLLSRSARNLVACGATLILCPDNVIQHAIPLAQAGSSVPWLPMPELVAEQVASDKHDIVGLLGHSWTMSASTYQTHLGLKGTKVVVPNDEDAKLVNRIILGELVYSDCSSDSQRILLDVVDRLVKQGAKAIILAASELPNAINPSICRMPLYDPSELLARAAIRRALA